MKFDVLKPDQRNARARRIAVSLVIALCPVMGSFGCGRQDWQAATYPASGQIVINGQPPEGAVVTLHAVEQKVDQRGSNPWGIVQADGTYSLSTYERGDGAPAGQYAVTVKWPLDVTDMAAAMVDRLGGAFSSKERSQWMVTIEERENTLAPIEIKGAKIQAQHNSRSHRRPPPMPAQAK